MINKNLLNSFIMKKTFFLFSVLMFVTAYCAQAQYPSAGKRDSSLKNIPKIGKVFGVIHDANTKQPVEFVAIAVLSVKDSSVVGGALTDAKGKFQIEELPYGRFKLRISFMGYKTFDAQPFIINPQNQMQDAGVINLS